MDELGNEARRTVAAAKLRGFCQVVLERLDVPADEAELIAENLVDADLRGVESHGVVRFPIYCQRLACRANNPRPTLRIHRETPATAVMDGDNGMGQLVGVRAMQLAIDKAREGLPAVVAVRGSNHYGAAAYYALMAARADLIGISTTIGGINHMVPWGGAEARLGNNPFAVALPAGEEFPVVLDMACSVAARGKIIVAAKTGTPIPADWAVGPDGEPTTDAVRALEGFVQPVGGAKGYALTLTIGLLSTMLTDAFFGTEVTHMYEDLERPQNVGHLMAAIPVDLFTDRDVYRTRMDKAVREMREAKRAPGVERIYLPGEREHLWKAERERGGVALPLAVLDELRQTGADAGVDIDPFLAT